MLSILSAIAAFSAVAFGIYWAFTDPRSPVPREWNPLEELAVSDPVTPVTAFKLRRVVADPATCLRVLGGAAQYTPMEPLEAADRCGIANRVDLSGVGASRLQTVETACETALRLAMWERHGIQPAALEHLGQGVRSLRHIGSYNCRPIRGSRSRMSTHATASSIDIGGVTLVDGTRVELLSDWDGTPAQQAFLRALRDSGCQWFSTVLGPDYNALHADHFHLQNKGWGTCR
ncbi:extensin-like domain-containing protein [Litoreibacter arenae]|uniref:Putative extensin protein n=1 Tax=Litoreibacter arenae DSM 19593 TaxID=1123360 RepID=S9RTU8_9RHOB|nr:extensin family protein [Litoreibacter arenae]EPX77389.1 putative extensin protein [Litoreibacter arenae DSM 19593]